MSVSGEFFRTVSTHPTTTTTTPTLLILLLQQVGYASRTGNSGRKSISNISPLTLGQSTSNYRFSKFMGQRREKMTLYNCKHFLIGLYFAGNTDLTDNIIYYSIMLKNKMD